MSNDKVDAYWTLYECLVTLSKLIAPFVPFMAETLWRNLAGVFGDRATESVHLCDYPRADSRLIDRVLSERMRLLREVASLGRSARMNARLKVRQPLASVQVVLADARHQAWLEAHDTLVRDELNVKQVVYTNEGRQYITYQVQPNFKRLGPRVGRLMPAVKKALGAADGAELLAEMNRHQQITLTVEGQNVVLDDEDIEVRLQAKEGWTAAQGDQCVVVLSTELSPELIREGFAQDLKRLIQERRKELACEYTDRIQVGLDVENDEIWRAVSENIEFLKAETLAVEIERAALDSVEPAVHDVAESSVKIYVRPVPKP